MHCHIQLSNTFEFVLILWHVDRVELNLYCDWACCLLYHILIPIKSKQFLMLIRFHAIWIFPTNVKLLHFTMARVIFLPLAKGEGRLRNARYSRPGRDVEFIFTLCKSISRNVCYLRICKHWDYRIGMKKQI